jgi:hypothetical protein
VSKGQGLPQETVIYFLLVMKLAENLTFILGSTLLDQSQPLSGYTVAVRSVEPKKVHYSAFFRIWNRVGT